LEDYKAHRVLHNTGDIPDKSINQIYEEERLAGMPPDAEVVATVTHADEPIQPQNTAPTPSKKPAKPAPWRAEGGIHLEYKYVGYCSCGFEIDTLTLDEVVDDKKVVVVVAWCNQCKKKWEQRKVAKL
jgi:hypothetical protein